MNALTPMVRRTGLLDRPEWDVFDRFFEGFRLPSLFAEETGFTPAFDVSETEKELIVRVEVPGIEKNDIKISLSSDVLTVTGEKRQEKEEKGEYRHSVERRYGAFSRTMRLPFEVEAEKVDATYKDGVLRITIPKSETARPKTIEVH